MYYTIEHLVMVFILGIMTGVVSTLFFTRRGLNVESTVSLLIMSIWLSMHVWAFFFDGEVSWLMDFAGFGAAGNFIGISIKDVKERLPVTIKK